MAPHSSTLAWKIPWMEEPGRLQSMGSLRVGHDWATSLSRFTFTHWRRKWQPTPVFLPGESQGWGAWWATVYGVTQSRKRLKWLSSSSRLCHSFSSKEQALGKPIPVSSHISHQNRHGRNPYFTTTQLAAPKAEVPFSNAKICRELNPSCIKSNLFSFLLARKLSSSDSY